MENHRGKEKPKNKDGFFTPRPTGLCGLLCEIIMGSRENMTSQDTVICARLT